jgi:Protein of unknown function (DUF2950)
VLAVGIAGCTTPAPDQPAPSMVGRFALVAAPAEYGVTGFKTFMVSYDGGVYERDLGIKTTEQFRQMERFNPDKSWSEVPE